jgi:hypothetical protein
VGSYVFGKRVFKGQFSKPAFPVICLLDICNAHLTFFCYIRPKMAFAAHIKNLLNPFPAFAVHISAKLSHACSFLF